MKRNSFKHTQRTKKKTPVLDLEFETGDVYLAELTKRANMFRGDVHGAYAVSDWING
ncbi:hypothetical protein [Micavibrio aeruginosavorus]|uniref:Uncharacterized protein n=1 Tax=Micavibrio aeruginosavorus EPB TaxID=349215 RepID=M4VGF5_9BACT|nr:hypothetical protein [Micavibrio aeruginosavorus]AGH97126.1 hypothetical protein A11S_291 [Micavibrio aeruginosavorus EPB]